MGGTVLSEVPAGDIARYHTAAIEMAEAARGIVKTALERGFSVETKLDRSLVTDADTTVERRLRELIGRWFPEHGVLGEEYPPTRPESAFQWIMDPIDGTEEFVHGIPTFGTMLALHHCGTPLVGVIDHAALDLRVTAARGLGTFRNGRPIRLPAPPASPRPEEVRLVLSARVNFTHHVDEGHLFEALTRTYPTTGSIARRTPTPRSSSARPTRWSICTTASGIRRRAPSWSRRRAAAMQSCETSRRLTAGAS
jgi:fructose-1,6-bisphosphatase/inositol monophosphatase family enzyme